MSTNFSTWDETSLGRLMEIRAKNPLKFLRLMYWDVLEHDSETSLKKAKESVKHYPLIQKELNQFKKSRKRLIKILIASTRNSDKF